MNLICIQRAMGKPVYISDLIQARNAAKAKIFWFVVLVMVLWLIIFYLLPSFAYIAVLILGHSIPLAVISLIRDSALLSD